VQKGISRQSTWEKRKVEMRGQQGKAMVISAPLPAFGRKTKIELLKGVQNGVLSIELVLTEAAI